jgi:hypothetical protein
MISEFQASAALYLGQEPPVPILPERLSGAQGPSAWYGEEKTIHQIGTRTPNPRSLGQSLCWQHYCGSLWATLLYILSWPSSCVTYKDADSDWKLDLFVSLKATSNSSVSNSFARELEFLWDQLGPGTRPCASSISLERVLCLTIFLWTRTTNYLLN